MHTVQAEHMLQLMMLHSWAGQPNTLTAELLAAPVVDLQVGFLSCSVTAHIKLTVWGRGCDRSPLPDIDQVVFLAAGPPRQVESSKFASLHAQLYSGAIALCLEKVCDVLTICEEGQNTPLLRHQHGGYRLQVRQHDDHVKPAHQSRGYWVLLV